MFEALKIYVYIELNAFADLILNQHIPKYHLPTLIISTKLHE